MLQRIKGEGAGGNGKGAAQAPLEMSARSDESHDFVVIEAPVKTKARMREKLQEYVKREDFVRPLTANILDPVRSTIVCDGPRSILRAVSWFRDTEDQAKPMPVVRCKNKFAFEDVSCYDGYRDLLLSVVYTGQKGLRVIGEIQFHDKELHKLKLKMHKLYKVKRAETASSI